MKKPVFYTEICYFLGIFLIAMGTAMTVLGDFGISMVVAPAYILHLKLSQSVSWFSFGVAEYVLQAVLLLVMACIVRKVKKAYFLSFLTAVFYAVLLDGSTRALSLLPELVLWQRLALYVVGDLVTCLGVAFVFRTYIPPEAYEMFVKELSGHFGIPLHRMKTLYDLGSLLVAVILSFLLLGSLQGVGVATVITALVNGTVIRLFSAVLEKLWHFEDKWKVRKQYE